MHHWGIIGNKFSILTVFVTFVKIYKTNFYTTYWKMRILWFLHMYISHIYICMYEIKHVSCMHFYLFACVICIQRKFSFHFALIFIIKK